ncbi:hypothetical protein MBLNU457_g0224t1 [Dothideomycetes sp. NU457]
MSRRTSRRKADLTDSWAHADEEDSTGELSPEIDENTTFMQQSSPPHINLSNSRAEDLDDALGRRRPKKAQVNNEMTNNRSQQSGSMMASAQTSNARRRTPASSQVLEQPSFIMPSVQHESEMEETQPRRRTPASSRTLRQSSSQSQPGEWYERRRPAAKTPPEEQQGASVPATIWTNVLSPTLSYVTSIFGLAAHYARPLIAYALMLYLIVGGLIMARNLVTTSFSKALSPICRIPGSSLLNLPFCETVNYTGPVAPVEFDKLVSAQAAFEDVLTTSAGGASLPLDMKRSEASIRDLKHVVQYSTLPSRNELVFEFSGFIDTARQAANDLTKYNSRIGRAVDRILTTNRWTLQVLDGIATTEANQGTLTRFASKHLNIFSPFSATPQMNQDILFDTYVHHTSAIEEQIATLILEAQALLQILNNLDDRLDLIAGIAMRDGIRAKDSSDELFSLLWTKLGGNKASVQKYERQMAVLRDVGQYRKLAWAHVSGTIIKLQAIAANLEDLRERVGRPETVGVREGLPLEMHVREIVMGVERLESVREEGRRIEGQRLRGILDKDDRLALDAS